MCDVIATQLTPYAVSPSNALMSFRFLLGFFSVFLCQVRRLMRRGTVAGEEMNAKTKEQQLNMKRKTQERLLIRGKLKQSKTMSKVPGFSLLGETSLHQGTSRRATHYYVLGQCVLVGRNLFDPCCCF